MSLWWVRPGCVWAPSESAQNRCFPGLWLKHSPPCTGGIYPPGPPSSSRPEGPTQVFGAKRTVRPAGLLSCFRVCTSARHCAVVQVHPGRVQTTGRARGARQHSCAEVTRQNQFQAGVFYCAKFKNVIHLTKTPTYGG